MGVSARRTDFPQAAGGAFRSYEVLQRTVWAMQSHYSIVGSTIVQAMLTTVKRIPVPTRWILWSGASGAGSQEDTWVCPGAPGGVWRFLALPGSRGEVIDV
jgi:hypothetical protein